MMIKKTIQQPGEIFQVDDSLSRDNGSIYQCKTDPGLLNNPEGRIVQQYIRTQKKGPSWIKEMVAQIDNSLSLNGTRVSVEECLDNAAIYDHWRCFR